MTREELEKQIAAVSKDIDILNCKIAEMEGLIRERARLRQKLQGLIIQLTVVENAESEFKPLFAFNGKIKDLSEALQSQIRKAQKYSQF